MPTILTVQNISKLYHIATRRSNGNAPAHRDSLRETISYFLTNPLSAIQAKQRLRMEELWALRDISFHVDQGEILGVIGRNGAGKSTLLKILSRITQPTTGRIELFGRVGSLLEIGTGFNPELTGRENTFLNGAILGMKRDEIQKKFDEIVAFSEIEKFIDTPVKYYSSGMYTRLAFAIAAHLEPEILIIDEVLAVGDAAFQKKCLGKMGRVAREGRTVIFVSHGMESVRKLCNSAIMLEHGKIVASGKVDDVVAKYIEEGAATQSVYAIPPPNPDESPPGYAFQLEIEDGSGKPAKAILVGAPWQIRVSFTITRRTENFIIGIGFRTITDFALRTSWSPAQTLEPGDYQAIFREEALWITPGHYPMVVGLSTNGRMFHYAEAGVLDIAEVSEGLELVAIAGAGIVLNPLKIEIERIS